ncbi:stage II sporulation protein M [Paenibacillus campi]|uniref:stage II sporulation protein M n=1 Tax=Paenibacillus campi TaxID=3106031 RepID=UPI002AFF0D52|nr:stage II sporulation protein M [Paenibacillus sp. SGZ-1014]
MLSFRTFWYDLRQNRSMLVVATVLFIIGLVAGIVLAEPLGNYLSSQLEQLRIVSKQLKQSGNVQMNYFLFIFFNNAVKSILIMLLGFFIGIIPVIFLVMNGMIIGYLLQAESLHGANVTELIVKGLLPHGIIEIPAIIIASAYGLKFGKLMLDTLTTWNETGRQRLQNERRAFLRSIVPASIWIVILLFIAAVIESTLTYWLMS